jgi:hypothetical protein
MRQCSSGRQYRLALCPPVCVLDPHVCKTKDMPSRQYIPCFCLPFPPVFFWPESTIRKGETTRIRLHTGPKVINTAQKIDFMLRKPVVPRCVHTFIAMYPPVVGGYIGLWAGLGRPQWCASNAMYPLHLPFWIHTVKPQYPCCIVFILPPNAAV